MDAKIELLQEYRPAHNNTAPRVAGFPVVCLYHKFIPQQASISSEETKPCIGMNVPIGVPARIPSSEDSYVLSVSHPSAVHQGPLSF